MCLIVAKTNKSASFSIADFKSSFTRNSDGTGIMYVEKGRIKVEKVCGELKNHLDLYYKHMHRDLFVLHHRMATHGDKTEINVHPFKVLDIDEGDPYDLYFAHNGVISMNKFTTDDTNKHLSDTHLFALQWMKPLMKKYPNIVDDPIFQGMLHDFIGSNNKLVFLRNDGNTWIFNKSGGNEHNGCWLSNSYSVTTHTTTYNYGKRHGVNYNHDADDYYTDMYSYDGGYYNDNGIWRREWNEANQTKEKLKESMTGLTINDLIESIEQNAGMTVEQLEELFVTDSFLVIDMMTLLSTKEVKEDEILREKSKVIAEKLYDLLQLYTKKAA